MTFTATPLDGSTTPIPMSSDVPDGTNTPVAVEGGPSKVTGGNTVAPVAVYQYDGYNVTQGSTTDAAVVGDVGGTVSAKWRGLSKLWNDVWDSVNHLLHINLKQVGGNAIAVGSNAVPVLISAATGYVTVYASNLAATVAATDYLFKWGAGGTTQVNHILLQNNTGADLHFDLDVAATAGSPIVATGQTLLLDVQITVLHLFTAAIQNVNGTASGNIVVRGWL